MNQTTPVGFQNSASAADLAFFTGEAWAAGQLAAQDDPPLSQEQANLAAFLLRPRDEPKPTAA
jgi:hypothetical protein